MTHAPNSSAGRSPERASLRAASRTTKLYRVQMDGLTVRAGYVIGQHRLTAVHRIRTTGLCHKGRHIMSGVHPKHGGHDHGASKPTPERKASTNWLPVLTVRRRQTAAMRRRTRAG